MLARNRLPLRTAAALSLIALVVLGAVMARRAMSRSGEAGDDGVAPIAVETGRALTLAAPEEGLLAAQNLEYAPALDPFDVEAFLRSIDSELADYVVERGERRVGFGELVSAAAERHAVNPRVLLILMELATGVVSAPSPDAAMRAAGYPVGDAPDAEAQVERLAATLSGHYVAASMGDEPMAVRGPGGEVVSVTSADPAPAAVARTLAETLSHGDLGAAVAGPRPGFADLYRRWFGDPREVPAFALGVSLPADAAWPFEGSKRHTGGPHLGSFCSQQDILAASGLDFGGESHEVLAMADGRYLGRGETTAAGLQAGKYVLLEHEGGVQVMYWHLAGFAPELAALVPGTPIPRGYPVGWSGRSGNQSAVHLHVELRRGAVATNPYSGVRVSWDDQTVDGWTVHMFRWPGRSDRGISYRGSAVRGATRVMTVGNCSCDQASADAVVSSQHPGTSTPRNGMDALTVLANYPDVGLLPSSNARTTALWTTAEKVWLNRLPWYYLIDARGVTVDEVVLDGVPQLSAPECARAVWLGVGQHRLTWRALGDGSTEPAVRLVAWPFEVPACAAPPSGAPPDGAAPPASTYDDAALCADASSADGETPVEVKGAKGETVAVTWRLRVSGTASWGEGYRLTFDDGWPLGGVDGVALPSAVPGQEVTVTLPVTVPTVGGRGHGVWRLRNADGVTFGPSLMVSAGPAPEAPEAIPTAPAAADAGAPELLSPAAEGGGTAYLPTHDVTLRWSAVDGAEGYVLCLSLAPTPADDPSPVYRERLGAGVVERRLLFGGDVARLHWQVTALTPQGEAASRVGAFGLDTGVPICSITATPAESGAEVAWRAEDALSGVASVAVEYRRGEDAAWRPLVTAGSVDGGEAPLVATRGGEYSVRCRAWDAAGNAGPWSAAEGAPILLGGGADVVVAGSTPSVTVLPGNRLLVEAPLRNVGEAAGDVGLSLVREGSAGVASEAHRWDVRGLAVGRALTLTAVIDGPSGPGIVGAADAWHRFSVRVDDGAMTQPVSQVDVCLAAPDAYEAGDTGRDGAPAGALLRPGERQTRSLHEPWDVDHARVAAEAGRRYVLWTDGLGPEADTTMALYGPGGDLVAASDDADGLGSRIEWTAPTDGVYRVTAHAWAPGSEGCGAGYTLRLQTVPPVPEIPESLEGTVTIGLPHVARE